MRDPVIVDAELIFWVRSFANVSYVSAEDTCGRPGLELHNRSCDFQRLEKEVDGSRGVRKEAELSAGLSQGL